MNSLYHGLFFAAMFGVAAPAATITAFQDPATVGNQSWGGSLGLEFNVQSAILVTALGTFDSGQDGIAGAINVTIYDRSTQLAVPGLVLTITGTQGFLVGGDRIVTLLTPILLPAGFQGTVAGYGYSSDPNGNNPSGFSTVDTGGGLIEFVASRYSFGPGYPGGFDYVYPGYGAGTFQFAAASDVPEPTTLSAMAVGLAALLISAAKRRR